MTDKHFKAILAKNEIARELRDHEAGMLAWNWIVSCLKDIEAFTGEGNQPSVHEILNCTKYKL